MDNKYFRKFLITVKEIINPIIDEMYFFDKTIGFNNEEFRDYMRNSSTGMRNMNNILNEIGLDSANFTMFANCVMNEEEREYLIMNSFYTVSKILKLPTFSRRDRYEIIKYFLKENAKKCDIAIADTKSEIKDGLISMAVQTGYINRLDQDNKYLNLEEREIKQEIEKRLKDDNRSIVFKTYMVSSIAYTNLLLTENIDIDELEKSLKYLEFTDDIIDEVKEYINYKLSKKKKEEPKKIKTIKKEIRKAKITSKEFNTLNSNIKGIYNIDTKKIVKEDITNDDIINVTANLLKMYIEPNDIILFLKKATKKINLNIVDYYQKYLREKILYLNKEKVKDLDLYYEEIINGDDEWLDIFTEEIENIDKNEYLYEIHEAVKIMNKR